MKTRLLATAAVLLGLTGCFEYDETFTLNADGSGSLAIDTTIDLSFEDELAKVKGAELGELGDLDLPTEESLKKDLAAIEGVTLRKCETEKKGKRTRLRIELDWKTLAALREIEGFSDRRFELKEDGDAVVVKYVFDGKKFFGTPTEGRDVPPEDEVSKKVLGVLESAREKARMKVVLRLPEKPLESSAKLAADDDKAVVLTALARPGSKPRLGAGEDLSIVAKLPRAALEKALAAEKAAAAKAAKQPRKKAGD